MFFLKEPNCLLILQVPQYLLVLKVSPVPVDPEDTPSTCWSWRYSQYLLVLKVPQYLLVLKVPPIPVGPEGTLNTCWPRWYPKYLLVLKVPPIPFRLEGTPNTCSSWWYLLFLFNFFLPNFHLLSPSSLLVLLFVLISSVGLFFLPFSVYVTLSSVAVTHVPCRYSVQGACLIASSTTPCFSHKPSAQISRTRDVSFRCAAAVCYHSDMKGLLSSPVSYFSRWCTAAL